MATVASKTVSGAPPPRPSSSALVMLPLPAAPAEISKIQNWRARIDSEVSAQLKFANDWGTLMEKPPATSIEEDIERKKAELEECVACRGTRALLLCV